MYPSEYTFLQFVPFAPNFHAYWGQLNIRSVSVEDLDKELEDIRSQIKEKTLMLDSSDTRIANLCKCPAQLWSEKNKNKLYIQNHQIG